MLFKIDTGLEEVMTLITPVLKGKSDMDRVCFLAALYAGAYFGLQKAFPDRQDLEEVLENIHEGMKTLHRDTIETALLEMIKNGS